MAPRRHKLQKLFSAFPDGWPGIGLVLLRLAVALNAMVQGVDVLAASNGPAPASWIMGSSAIVAGIALLIGLLTPVAGASTAIGYAVTGSLSILHGGALADFNLAAMSIVLVLLGPGAFSLDARFFGRREIIIPEGRRTPR